MEKKILFAFVRYSWLLDALVLIQLVPFSHYLVSLNEYDTLGERLHNPYYWLAFGFTYVCGVGVMGYMKWQNKKLND
ncbi:hypothetical protein [Olivibacter sitiensis]|uniref:hypothetical protein n=1 Tax=Olivibacter sitiensis TaxID=376470 RepID=UPI0012F7A192|nr:hypothetical protein [Olivibacter sitiensis]